MCHKILFLLPSCLVLKGDQQKPIEFQIQGLHSKSSFKTQSLFMKLWRERKFWGKWMSLDSLIVIKVSETQKDKNYTLSST